MIISFSSIGHDPLQVPSPEFVATLRDLGPSLFVGDASRSWGNAPGLVDAIAQAIAVVRTSQRIDRLVMIGQSMGAFAAMVAASQIPTDLVLAFGPQSRIDPAGETRWREWTTVIKDPTFPTCPIPNGPALWLFHGLLDDAAIAKDFPQGGLITHVLFPDRTHHDLCPHLKSTGVLRGLVQAILTGDRRRALRIAAGAGGINRKKLIQRVSTIG